jgi:hypothetical protein
VIGCASRLAPDNWLSTPEQARTEAYGAWVYIEYAPVSRVLLAEGELLAIDSDSLFVLSHSGLIAIASDQLVMLKLDAYESNSEQLASWTVLGTISTLSHGLFLVATAPGWILLGSAATAAQSYNPREEYNSRIDPKLELISLRKYARFPAGLPAWVREHAVKPKQFFGN